MTDEWTPEMGWAALTNGQPETPMPRDEYRLYRPLTDAVDEYVQWAATPSERVYLGLPQFDELMRGTAPGEITLLVGFSHSGKCVTRDTVFTLASGERVLAKDLWVGQVVIGDGGPVRVEAIEDNGVRPIVHVETHCGRHLRVTLEHPVLLSDGSWLEAQYLLAGDVLTGEPAWLVGAGGSMDALEARFLGHLTGDGGMTHSPSFTNTDPDVIDSVRSFLNSIGFTLAKAQRPADWNIVGLGKKRAVRHWLTARGMSMTTSHHKRVPVSVMTGGRQAALGFLAGLLDTDGSVEGSGRLVWYSISRDLLEDCQDLLARLGYRAKLLLKRGVYNENEHLSWRLTLSLREGAADLFHELPLASRKRLHEAKWRRDSGPRRNPPLTVKSVTLEPPEPTLAVQVSGDHTHVTNGIVTHNTLVVTHAIRSNRERRVVMVTPDETRQLVLVKLVAAETGVGAVELEQMIQNDEQEGRRLLRETAERFSNLAVFDNVASIHGIEAAVREARHALGGVDLVVFDYLDLIDGFERPNDALSALKILAKEEHTAMWVLHQSSRSAGADGAAVTLTSGAYGGEQAATHLLGVYRKKYQLLAQLRDLDEKLVVARSKRNADQEEILEYRRAEVEHDLRRHEHTVTVNLPKNKRPPSSLLEEGIDYELDQTTGRLYPLGRGELPTPLRRSAALRQLDRHDDGEPF